MSDIHITRNHSLGLAEARKLAFKWAEAAEERLDMECTYEEGKTSDHVTFARTGAHGELKVTAHQFVLNAHLGLLLGVFRDRIENEIVRNLDELLAHESPVKAFHKVIGKVGSGKPAAKKRASHRKA